MNALAPRRLAPLRAPLPVRPAPRPAPFASLAPRLIALFGLTRREAEVALLVAEGLSNAEIADRLFISLHTARHHVENVMGKIGVTTRAAVLAVSVATPSGTTTTVSLSLPAADDVRARHGLTRREAEVALLLAEGLSNGDLADRLFVSPHTARHHVENVMGKIGVTTRAAVLPAILAGVPEPAPARIYAWTRPAALPLAA